MMKKTSEGAFHCLRNLLLLAIPILLSVSAKSQVVEPSTKSPYQTIYTHLYFLQPDSYDPASAAMAIDPSTIKDSTQRIRRAIQLKQILDSEGLFVNLGSLPTQDDYVDSISKKSQYGLFPKRQPEIYLSKKGEDWYYSSQTVQLIPEMHRKLFPFGSSFLMNLFPEFGNKTFFGLAIWQYSGMLFILLVAFLFYWLVNRLVRPFVRRLLSRWSNSSDQAQIMNIGLLTSALTLVLMIQAIIYLLPMLLLPIETVIIVRKILKIVQVILFALLLIRVINFFAYHLKSVVGQSSNRMDDQLLPLAKKIIKIVIVIGAFLNILSLLDVNITALIAGVSLGGLAIALAAQDAVKNFIGSIMIFADKPFQIGDYVVGSGFEGEVIEVGFRTTRIKALDTSIIAVPNGSISNINVENKGVRTMRLMNTTIGLTYGSQPEDLKTYISALKQFIIDHPDLHEEGYYVHLKEMADSSINIMFRTYIKTLTYADEMRIKEEILFAIMELAKKNSLDFAFPSRTIYTQSAD